MLEAARRLTYALFIARCVVCDAPTRGYTCGECLRAEARPFDIDGIPGWAASTYGGPLAEHLQALKYRDETRWAAPLAALLAERLPYEAHAALRGSVLIPVPLHPARLLHRGYNQCALLARALGRSLRLSVDTGLLARRSNTTAQATLGADARAHNLVAAFEVREAPTRPLILLDDVTTTGATLRECLLCLRKAGAIVRGVVTVAQAGRTDLPPPSSRNLPPLADDSLDGLR